MAIRVLWDEQETAILVDYYVRIQNGEMTRTEAISNASKELREFAVRRGILIDEIFRNTNGITMQMSKIEDLILGREGRLSKAPQVFENVVKLYFRDKVSFNKILEEVRELKEENKSVQEEFFEWLSDKVSVTQISELYFSYLEVETFCLERKILKQQLFKTIDVKTVSVVKNFVDSNKVFRFNHKKNMQKMQTAIKYYFDFIKQYQASIEYETLEQVHEEQIDSLITTLDHVHDFSSGEKLGSLEGESIAVVSKKSSSSTQKIDMPKVTVTTDSKAFQSWLVEEMGLTMTLAHNYASDLNNYEQMAMQLCLESTNLYGTTYEEAQRTADLLMNTQVYKEANDSGHNRLRASLTKFLQYLSEDYQLRLNSSTTFSYGQEKLDIQEDLTPYEQILQVNFPKGYRVESNLELRRFVRYYNAMYGTELDINDETVKEKIKRNILCAGIRHDEYVFAIDSLVDIDTKERLMGYIERSFEQGKKVLYYRALFEEFNDVFLGQRIYDEDMLRTYLVHECGEDYIFERSFISQEKNVQIDPKDEIKQLLISSGVPIKTTELYKKLAHFPADKIDLTIHTNREFVMNTWGEYFHVSLLDFSEDELDDIASIIQHTIDENHFISGYELICAINRTYPNMLERFPQFSEIGIRGTIAYRLGDRFSFNGNIISALDKQMTMSEVFAEFSRTHRTFTLDELNVLKNEMNSTIYFDVIYKNSLRISQQQFVSKAEANFDIIGTDKAISHFCTNKYIPLAGITSFGTFPYAGFPWNIYLLEHYVASYSVEYKLLHTGFNADNCVGGIVRRDVDINNFNDLITHVLAHSGIELNKEDALQYLYDWGYLARRKFSAIDQILVKARALKG